MFILILGIYINFGMAKTAPDVFPILHFKTIIKDLNSPWVDFYFCYTSSPKKKYIAEWMLEMSYWMNDIEYDKDTLAYGCADSKLKFINRNIFEWCPDRCHSKPCLFVENAFEDSCEPVLENRNESANFKSFRINYESLQNFIFKNFYKNDYGSLENYASQKIQKIQYYYFDDNIKNSFKCECFNGFEWKSDHTNDLGGTCEPKKQDCTTINCIVGECVIFENKPICKLVIWEEIL